MNYRINLISSDLFKKKFKTSSHFQLIEWNEVPEIIRNSLYELYDELEVYGVFMPSNSSGFLPKVAYKEVALVYFHLLHHRNLPRYIQMLNEQKTRETLVQMVLDDILQIEGEDGFQGGTQSVSALFGDYFGKEENYSVYLNQLSLEAIRFAMALPNTPLKILSQKLYTYNAFPIPEPEGILEKPHFEALSFVFNNLSEEEKAEFAKIWLRPSQNRNSGWINFHRAQSQTIMGRNSNKSNFKLYLSPIFTDLPLVFKRIQTHLNSSQAFSFKFGENQRGLLRPDKFVLYFHSSEEALDTGHFLAGILSDLPVQGVPFTRQIGGTGMVSFGMDPPLQEVIQEIEGGSWRAQLADILASSILVCKKKELDMESSLKYIKAQLYAHNIDPINWSPLF